MWRALASNCSRSLARNARNKTLAVTLGKEPSQTGALASPPRSFDRLGIGNPCADFARRTVDKWSSACRWSRELKAEDVLHRCGFRRKVGNEWSMRSERTRTLYAQHQPLSILNKRLAPKSPGPRECPRYPWRPAVRRVPRYGERLCSRPTVLSSPPASGETVLQGQKGTPQPQSRPAARCALVLEFQIRWSSCRRGFLSIPPFAVLLTRPLPAGTTQGFLLAYFTAPTVKPAIKRSRNRL